jgi:hypothetical protein
MNPFRAAAPVAKASLLVLSAALEAGCPRGGAGATADAASSAKPSSSAAPDATSLTIVIRSDGISLNGTSIGSMAPAKDNAFYLGTLADAIHKLPKPANGWTARVEIPNSSPYRDLIRVLYTAGQSEVSRFEIVLGGEARPPPGVKSYPSPEPLLSTTSSDGCVKFDIDPHVTFTLAKDKAQKWVTGQASFVEHRTWTHAPRCASPATTSGSVTSVAVPPPPKSPVKCAQAFKDDAPARLACAEGAKAKTAEASVSIGGPNGCLLPALLNSESVSGWAVPLAAAIDSLGLGGEVGQLGADLEAASEDAVSVARAAGNKMPVTFTVSKGPTPPAPDPDSCKAMVHTKAELKLAAARWLGAGGDVTP